MVVVTGAGGALAIADVAGQSTDTQTQSFQSDTVTEDGDDSTGTATESETETAAESTDQSTPESDESDGGGAAAASEETETPSTVTETSTPESSDEATAAGQADSNTDANADTAQSGETSESDTSAQGELTSCTVIDESGEYELTTDVGGSSETCLAIEASNVVLDGNGHSVTGSGSGTGIQVAGGTSDVTVRNVDVSNWDVAVKLGGRAASGPQANLVEVRATGSNTGVRLMEADGSAMKAVTAQDNEDGIVLVETSDVTASELTVAGNDEKGLWLARGVTDSSFSIVQATDNGEEGINFGMGAVDNFVGDATVTDNDGPGVEFADTYNNVLADSRVANNGGAGVLSYPADGDTLENVEFSGNADGAYRDEAERAGAVADAVQLQNDATVRFEQGVTRLAAVEAPASLPQGSTAAGPAVDVTLRDGGDATATVAVPVEASGDVTAYQRVDGSWEELSDVTVENGEAEISVSRSGVVVPVVSENDAGSSDAESSDGESNDGESNDSGSSDGESSGEETTETATDGDAVRADTSPTNELASTTESSEDTAALAGGQAPAVDTSGSTANQNENESRTLVIGTAEDGTSIDYALQVDGSVSKVTDGNVTADANDTVSQTDGTTTVTGTTASADAYLVDGELLQVRETGDTTGYFVQYDGTIGGNATES